MAIVTKVVKPAVKVAFKIHIWLVKTHYYYYTPRKRWERTREEGERENQTKPNQNHGVKNLTWGAYRDYNILLWFCPSILARNSESLTKV